MELAFILFIILQIIDYHQTRAIVASPEFYEINPILGRSPSKWKTLIYFIACGLLVLGIGVILPDPFGLLFIVFSSGIEFGYVTGNYFRGVRI